MDSKIYLNDTLTTWQEANLNPNELLGSNWVYTIINSYAHQPMHVGMKLRYALDSFEALYGVRPEVSVEQVESRIRNLLYYGLYPEHGNTLILHLATASDGEPYTILNHLASTPYDGYSLLSLRPKAAITNYEIPFEKHHTTISRSAAKFADHFAIRNGAGIALRANRAGALISAGDNPLFALRKDVLLTTPINKGARPSAERELMMELCHKAGINVIEEELRVDEITTYEEMMVFTPMGIQSIGSAGNILLHSIIAHRLETHLRILTREGILR